MWEKLAVFEPKILGRELNKLLDFKLLWNMIYIVVVDCMFLSFDKPSI